MKLKYIILPIIATSFAISSCNDFLDREPLTDNVNEGFFTEPSQLQAYCNKKYELLPDFKDTNLFTNDQTSDNQSRNRSCRFLSTATYQSCRHRKL